MTTHPAAVVIVVVLMIGIYLTFTPPRWLRRACRRRRGGA
jgi:hypothetical protein